MGDGNDAESVVIVGIYGFKDFRADFRCQFIDLAVIFDHGADGKHFLYRAFSDDLRFSIFIGNDHAHPSPREVPGDFINLLKLILEVSERFNALFLFLSLVDNGNVHQVFQSGLIETVQERVAEHARVFLPMDVHMVFQHHPVLSQGSCFVRAQDIQGAKVLDGIQIFDDGFLFGHRNGSLGKAGCDGHRQHFRSQSDGDGKA